MSELLALGVSHKTAPLDLRERLSLTEGSAVGALRELTAADGIHEAAAISTCNRTELYLVVSDTVEAESTALGVLTRQADIPPTELLGHLYSLRASEAARPPLPGHRRPRLDDRRRGRDPGPGQARLRAGAGRGRDRADPQPPLPRRARRRRARPRGDRGSARRALSIPSVAVELARRTLGDLAERRVLVVGAGETAELVARALVARGVATVFVANRHYDRAIGLAQRFGGEAVRFEELPDAARGRRHRRLRDQLAAPHRRARRARAGDGAARRAAAAARSTSRCRATSSPPAARSPASASTTSTTCSRSSSATPAAARPRRGGRSRSSRRSSTASSAGSASLEVVPTIAALRERGDEVVRRVLAENEGRWESLTEADRERLEVMARAIASRLLHEPTLRMKRSAGGDEAYALRQRPARAVRPRRRAPSREGETRRRASPSCAASAARSRLRRGTWPLRIGTRGSALALAQARHGRRDARRRRAGRGHLRRRARRQGALRARGRAGAARRRGRHRRPLGQGRPGGAARRPDARRGAAPRGRRATPGSAPARASTTCPRAPGSAPRACAGAPSCSPPGPTSRSSSCTATSTPACASSRRATSTRSCSPSPACAGSAAQDEVAFALPERGDDARRRPGLAAAADPRRRRGGRCGSSSRSPTGRRCAS